MQSLADQQKDSREVIDRIIGEQVRDSLCKIERAIEALDVDQATKDRISDVICCEAGKMAAAERYVEILLAE